MDLQTASYSVVSTVEEETQLVEGFQPVDSVSGSVFVSSLQPKWHCLGRRSARQIRNWQKGTSLKVLGFVCLVSTVVYWIVPQIIIDRHLAKAVVRINACVLEIGPNADSELKPKLAFSVSRDVMQVPLISYTARMHGLRANIFLHMHSKESGLAGHEQLLIGTFESSQTLDIDSTRDLNVDLQGKVKVTQPSSLSKVVNLFLKTPNVTVSAEAKQNVYARVWGWLPCPLFGITVQKALTLQAFDNFRAHPLQLAELLHVHGAPSGELNVTASARLFNPSPVTIVLQESVRMQVFYSHRNQLVALGTLNVAPPLVVVPGSNTPSASVTVLKDTRNAPALRAAISAYLGPQQGFSLAGMGPPLAITLSDAGEETSSSSLIREALKGFSAKFDFKPKPIYFLSDITADVFGIFKPPFYSCIVHVRIKNPVPQKVRIQQVQLVATHQTLKGPILYRFDHTIQPPEYDSKRYVMRPFQNRTFDFALNVLSEVNWKFLSSQREIRDLIKDAVSMKVVVGVSVNLTISIDDGFEQVVPYENNQLEGRLCFHMVKPRQNCGGLPNMPLVD
eukprot:TRINITY_DN72422_c0_g1_i1.p1 TRINITY_DN72422_c0_g1~~TRINITY_DN72422_c0_g1_i1.p1  ORF type:complete len:563 (-),score=28.55 TRINITY_DN72422_c0_g1_i1:59-1747(-)